MQKLKAEIERRLVRHLAEHPFWRHLAEETPAAFAAVQETLTAPGKRLRPRLFCQACRAGGCEPFPSFAPVVLALELAHSFILIHDDIIDRSAVRRGAPTLPEQMNRLFAKKPADGFRGSDFALVTGDLIYTLAIESLLQAEASDAQKTGMIRLFTRAALDTGRGALLEMRAAQTPLDELTVENIETIYALKTGSYTFALPLQLAAVCSGNRRKPDSLFSALGTSAGIAFQLKNDLQDLRRWLDDGPLPDDIRDGRRTWALVYAGSREALVSPRTLAAVEKAKAEHTRRALDITADAGLKELLRLALS